MAREVVKKVTVKGPKGQKGFAILYADGTIFIEWVRFSYPHLDKPWKKKGDEGKAKFSIVSLLGKKTHAAAIELVQERIDELLKENKIKKLKSDRIFMRDGDDSDQDEYEGFMTVNAREERRPPLRDRRNEVVDPEDAGDVFRPGFWGAVLIRPWFMNNDWGKRVNAGLSSVQFLMKDEEFGEGRLSDDDLDDTFRSYDDDDDDDGSYDDDDDDDRPARKSKSKKRPADDDDDGDDDDDRPAWKSESKAKSKSKSRDYDDDDDEDDDI